MRTNKLLSLLSFFFAVSSLTAQNEDFRKNAPQPGPPPKVEMGDYETFELNNGLQVILVENHRIPRVSYQVFIDAPEIAEGEKAGRQNIMGDLLSRGTKTKTKAEIDQAVDLIGASFSTSASGLFGSCLSKHQDQLLAIMSDVLLNPSFPEEELEKIRTQVLSGLATQKDNANAIASNVASALNFGLDHPYGEQTTEETVKNITLDDCKSYYDNYFRPNIAYLVVVGDTDLAAAKKVARKYFGDWKRGEVSEANVEDPERPEGTRVSFVDKAGAVQSVVRVTQPVDLEPGHPDALAARVMNTILGGYFNSRLQQNIREDKGYSYGAGSFLRPDREIGVFGATASVRNEVTDSAVHEFLYEINRLRDELVPEDELSLVKNYLTGDFALDLERPQTVASYALNTARYDLPKDYYATYLERLDALTAGDIQRVARKYINPDAAHVLVVGAIDEVAEKLKPFADDGEVHYYNIYGNPIDRSNSAAPAGMTGQDVIDRYVEVIGGRDRLKSVNDVKMQMSTTVQGMPMVMEMKNKRPNMMSMQVMMNGNVVNETRFDGEKALVSAMGNKQVLEGEEAASTRRQAIMFSELEYADMGYDIMLKGVEQIEGQSAYKVVVKTPQGGNFTEYYAVDSGYKIRSVQTEEANGRKVTVTNDFADYQEVSGVQFPHKMTTSGAMPFPIEMTVESIEVNTGLEDSSFQIE